jgi:hypothetical protein
MAGDPTAFIHAFERKESGGRLPRGGWGHLSETCTSSGIQEPAWLLPTMGLVPEVGCSHVGQLSILEAAGSGKGRAMARAQWA